MKKEKRRFTVNPGLLRSSSSTTGTKTTTSIATDPCLGYKIRVLLYDMRNIKTNPDSERRIDATVDEHYISFPYFNDDEAQTIKTAIVDVDLTQYAHLLGGETSSTDYNNENISVLKLQDQTFETAICSLLNTFLDKRLASGDSRPCGPHHMAPLYASLFDIQLEDINDAKFLGRLRKFGL